VTDLIVICAPWGPNVQNEPRAFAWLNDPSLYQSIPRQMAAYKRLYTEMAPSAIDYGIGVPLHLGYAHSGHPERRWRSVDVLQS
jgi:hypothetical protein